MRTSSALYNLVLTVLRLVRVTFATSSIFISSKKRSKMTVRNLGGNACTACHTSISCAVSRCLLCRFSMWPVSYTHLDVYKRQGWTKVAKVDILDEAGDLELPVEGGKRIQKNYVGANLANYDSILVLSHFKGHPMGGYLSLIHIWILQ